MIYSVGFFLFSVLISCNHADSVNADDKKFLDLASIDSSVKPGDNFYQYVNGRWINKTKIPASQSGSRRIYGFILSDAGCIASSARQSFKGNAGPGTIEQKVGDYYASGMDSVTIDKRGLEPLKPYLAKITGITNSSGIMEFQTELQNEGTKYLFNMNIGPDEKNSNSNIVIFGQGGLGLPDRDYYFKKDSGTLAVVKAYKIYVNRLFRLMGDDSLTAAKKTVLVYNLEKQMAESHKTNVELRDPQSNYHKVSVSCLG